MPVMERSDEANLEHSRCLGSEFGLLFSWLYLVLYYLPIVCCIDRIPDDGVILFPP